VKGATALPPIVLERTRLSEEGRAQVRALLDAHRAYAERSPHHRPLTEVERERFVDLLDVLPAGVRFDELPILTRVSDADLEQPIRALIQSPGFSPIHLVRLSIAMGEIHVDGLDRGRFSTPHDLSFAAVLLAKRLAVLDAYRKTATDLRMLAAALDAAGIDPDALAWSLLDRFSAEAALRMFAPDQIWPYFRERLSIIAQVLGRAPPTRRIEPYLERDLRRTALLVLSMFPEPPPSLEDMLWDLALGTAKSERALARRCLAATKQGHRRIEALGSVSKDVRREAARWIGQLRDAPAIPALEAAVAREKNDAAKGAMMEALERLGVSIDRYCDHRTLLDEARASKRAPGDLAWFPFDGIEARWLDGGPVPGEILAHLIARSQKLGSPEPDPILRRASAMIAPESRHRIGRRVLDAWIEHDVRSGSAVEDKGVLAVAAACCGGDAEAPIAAYLKAHYGYRLSQCKALVRVLSWIDDPVATQRLLAVADRFRTRGIQAEAKSAVEDLIERRGLTEEALADRSVPACGFDRAPSLLDAGGRPFVLVLSGADRIALREPPSERTLTSLPAPRKDQDPAGAAAARRALGMLRKTLGDVVDLQRSRLHTAMCTERCWRAPDFVRFVLRHPIMGRLAARLVWTAGDRSFRPLEDGTLTDASDEAFTLAEDAEVRVAHRSTLPELDVLAWRRHLADYEVDPLFDQLSHERYGPIDGETVDDFIGHVVEAFTLRSILLGRGYLRGEAGDGGVFWAYLKGFGGIEARFLFSGNALPEENRRVALGPLSFSKRTRADERPMIDRIAPKDLPPPLVAECVADLASVARTGAFDPDWESRFAPLW
jgi:hypothetical protein